MKRSKETVVVSDLDAMERLVRKNYNLVWDGWNVLLTRRHPAAFFYKDGRFIKGKWYRTETLRLNRNGWVVPSELFGA